MKIIDLLNKIANGEEVPKKIVFKGLTYTWYEEEKDYVSGSHWLFDEYVIQDILNDEVEILETTITYKTDKIEKIEKIEDDRFRDENILENCWTLKNKINEIIDKVNEL